MSEDQNHAEQPSKAGKNKPQPEQTVTLSMAELTAMINDAVAAADARRANETTTVLTELTNAIKDSRKPWKDPLSEANDKLMRDQMRETNRRIARNIAASRAACPHFQGSNELSDFQGSLSSIAVHFTDTGVQWGICTNCQRQFWPGDPDYVKQMRRKHGNRASAAGRRQFLDPAAAMQASIPKREDRADLVTAIDQVEDDYVPVAV